jgi:hypothetical protein
MKRIIYKTCAFIILFSVFLFTSCEKNDLSENGSEYQGALINDYSNDKGINHSQSNTSDICGKVLNFELVAAQDVQVGTLKIWNTEGKVYVNYTTENNWVIGQTHLYVGSLQGVPLNRNGNPNIGRFPFIDTFIPPVTSCLYEIDIQNVSDCFVVAAQANVYLLDDQGNIVRSESAWSAGSPFHGPDWATYTDYCKQECEECVYETVAVDLIAGKSHPVGSLEITNDEAFLSVSYLTSNDWFIDKTHLYVGSLDELPINNGNNPVIGHFPYKEDQGPGVNIYTTTIPIDELPDCYVVAAHAEVYKMVGGIIVKEEGAWGFGIEYPGSSRWWWFNEYCTQICE